MFLLIIRDLLYSELTKIPGIEVPIPEGAFYAMVKLPVENSEHFATWLLSDFRDNNETVMLAPGAGKQNFNYFKFDFFV